MRMEQWKIMKRSCEVYVTTSKVSAGFLATQVRSGVMAIGWESLEKKLSTSSSTSALCAATRKHGVDIARWSASLTTRTSTVLDSADCIVTHCWDLVGLAFVLTTRHFYDKTLYLALTLFRLWGCVTYDCLVEKYLFHLSTWTVCLVYWMRQWLVQQIGFQILTTDLSFFVHSLKLLIRAFVFYFW